MHYNKSNIAIILPSYNEGSRLKTIVEKIKSIGFDSIIVVDDGSTDDSIFLIESGLMAY